MRFDDHPREPMPKSFKPVWIMIGLAIAVIAATGLVSFIVDYFATH